MLKNELLRATLKDSTDEIVVNAGQIECFFSRGESTTLQMRDGTKYVVEDSLSDIYNRLSCMMNSD